MLPMNIQYLCLPYRTLPPSPSLPSSLWGKHKFSYCAPFAQFRLRLRLLGPSQRICCCCCCGRQPNQIILAASRQVDCGPLDPRTVGCAPLASTVGHVGCSCRATFYGKSTRNECLNFALGFGCSSYSPTFSSSSHHSPSASPTLSCLVLLAAYSSVCPALPWSGHDE